MKRNIEPLLTKINRYSAWVLLVAVSLYLASGYGMTKGLIEREDASFLHHDLLPLITISAFFVHSFLSVRIAFIRWRIRNQVTMTLLSIIFLIGFFSLVYLELFYQKRTQNSVENPRIEKTVQKVEKEIQEDTVPPKNIEPTTKPTETAEDKKTFTLSELAEYDGKDGNPAYAAVDGVVYDLTGVFPDGKHYEHFAGQELTNAFYTKHAKTLIMEYPVVGVLE